MRNPLLVLVSLATVAISAQAQTPPKTPKPPPNMALYQFVMLRTGTNTSKPGAEEAAKMQQAHLDALVALNQKRINLLFGPFLDRSDLRGIAVLDVPDGDAARKAGDPAVKGDDW